MNLSSPMMSAPSEIIQQNYLAHLVYYFCTRFCSLLIVIDLAKESGMHLKKLTIDRYWVLMCTTYVIVKLVLCGDVLFVICGDVLFVGDLV